MNKSELLENYTAEQLADMAVKLQEQIEILQEILTENERKLNNNIISVVVGGTVKEYQIEEIGDIVRAYEEIKMCKELNKQFKTALPTEYLKVLVLNQTVTELQAETDSLKQQLNRSQTTITQIDGILEKLFGVKHDAVEYGEFEQFLREKVTEKVADFLPTEPIKVADMLISAKGECEPLTIGNKKYTDTYRIFDTSALRQIAEHLLIYCNANVITRVPK